jgi:hypothetical protein
MGIVSAELLKLKRSFPPVFALAAGILPALANILMQMMSPDFSWPIYATKWLLFLNLGSLLSLQPLAGFLFTNEYERKTMGALVASPAHRLNIFGAKLFVFILLELLCFAVSFAVMMLWGFRSDAGFPADPGMWATIGQATAGLFVIHAACAPASLLAGLLGKRTVLPVGLALVHLALYRMFVFSDAGMFIPSAIPSPWIISVTGHNIYGVSFTLNPIGSAISLAAFAVVPLIISAVLFSRTERF